jgi:hypothetical protein
VFSQIGFTLTGLNENLKFLSRYIPVSTGQSIIPTLFRSTRIEVSAEDIKIY